MVNRKKEEGSEGKGRDLVPRPLGGGEIYDL